MSEKRDDTEWLQGYLDCGEQIPPGIYYFSKPLTLPPGYHFRKPQDGQLELRRWEL